MTQDTQAVAALRLLLSSIREAVREAGPLGIRSGTLYAMLMTHGCSIGVYEQVIAALEEAGQIRRRGHLLLAP